MEPLVVAGNLDALETVRNYVQRAAEQAGLAGRAAYRLKLAVDEVVDNIITYGYRANGLEGDLKIAAGITDEALLVEIEDTSPPFDLLARPAPDLSLPYDQRPPGKLGIYLAKLGCDELTYESDGQRNRTSFKVYRGSPDAG